MSAGQSSRSSQGEARQPTPRPTGSRSTRPPRAAGDTLGAPGPSARGGREAAILVRKERGVSLPAKGRRSFLHGAVCCSPRAGKGAPSQLSGHLRSQAVSVTRNNQQPGAIEKRVNPPPRAPPPPISGKTTRFQPYPQRNFSGVTRPPLTPLPPSPPPPATHQAASSLPFLLCLHAQIPSPYLAKERGRLSRTHSFLPPKEPAL